MRRLQRDGALGNNASNPSTADVTCSRSDLLEPRLNQAARRRTLRVR
jgi:hypothetical protein